MRIECRDIAKQLSHFNWFFIGIYQSHKILEMAEEFLDFEHIFWMWSKSSTEEIVARL